MRILELLCRVVVALFVAAATATAQTESRFEGDFALAVDGNVIMGVHLTQSAGTLGGSVSAGGKTLPVTGTVRDGRASFVTTSPTGGFLHWDAAPTDQGGLAVTLAPTGADGRPDMSLAQQHVLTRRAGGMGATVSQAAQQWIVRLAAVADSVTVWCAAPSLHDTEVCVKALQILRRVAPALMVARFTSGGQAASLMRVLASGPGSPSGSAGSAPAAQGSDMFAALQPPPAQPTPTPAPAASASVPTSSPPDSPPTQPAPGTAPAAPAASPARSSGVAAVGRALLGGGATQTGSPTNATPFRGDWMLYVEGTEVATLHFDESSAGAGVSGTISILGDAKPFSGALTGNAVEFPFAAEDGTPTQWHLVPQGERLTATISGPNGTQQQSLQRPGGWTDATPLAQRWRRTLEGRSITRTTRTNGGSAGGATTDVTLNFCPNAILRTETRSAVSVSVPGAGGGETSRASSNGTWKVVSRGEVAALATTSDDGRLQFGIKRGDGETIYVVQELMRLGSARCE